MLKPNGAVTALLATALLGCPSPTPTTPPPDPTPTEAERAAVSREDALVAFARLYGVVRYFHPTDAAHDADWAQVAADGVHAAAGATRYGELAKALRRTFAPYTHGLALWVAPSPEPPNLEPPPRRADLIYWQHQGYEGTSLSLFRPPYASVRVTPQTRYERRFSEAPDPTRPHTAPLLGPLHARIPLVLEPEAAHRTPAPLAPTLDPTDFSSRAVREALLIDVWAVLRHFYPYQEDVSVPWEDVLRQALRDTADDSTEADLIDSIRTLTRALQDGHARVEREGHRGIGWLPVRTACVGDAVVVAASEDPNIAVGEVIATIDGTPAWPRAQAIAERLSGTPQWRRFRACTWDGARGPGGNTVTLGIERGGAVEAVQTRYSLHEIVPDIRPDAFGEVEPGVLYVDLTRLSWTDLKPRLEELVAAEGIVFDLRGYPIHNDDLLDHLMSSPEDAAWMHVPRFIEPGGAPVSFADIGWNRRPSTPHIEAPTVFLINAAAISYAESILSYVQTHSLGTLVGSTTAGANGDIVRHDTLGGFYVVFSGMRVTRHDGTPFHNDGVTPEIQVRPSVAGIAEGRDEVLERGLDVLRPKLRPAAP
ncbi:MAG: S41 family peptidase [Nannocystales bacterium]